MGTYSENMSFEADTRRTAEAVWSLEPGSCQPNHYENNPAIRELDGIAYLRDVTHLLMVTTSTKLLKVKEDVKKLNAAEAVERKKSNAITKWLITEKQLDAEHILYCNKNTVRALTLEQFRRRFFDGFKYNSLRIKAPFGSARDPSNDSVTISDNAYVALPMFLKSGTDDKYKNINIDAVAQLVMGGSSVVIVAPFGAGKSFTTREIFRNIAQRYTSQTSDLVPLTMNLREHWGQDFYDEILERHARSIGYTPREDLVIAWRAGMSCLLLDGFDEVASQSVIRKNDKNFMRDARRKALQGVRDFVAKAPNGIGMMICGRDHYFDNEQEMVNALGLTGKAYSIVKLDEFDEEGVRQFLKNNGIEKPLPDWLPRKPLILTYLVQRNLFDEILGIDSSKGYGYAWDNFLERIAERESGLEFAVMEPHTLRAVLERLAFSVRSKVTGTGPITGGDLSDAYNLETGQFAGEGVIAQLQRLPGLTQRDLDPGSRSFVDEDMLAALQGSAFAKLLLGGYDDRGIQPISELSDKAIAMASFLLQKSGASPDTLISVVERLHRQIVSDRISPQLVADCIAVTLTMAIEYEYTELNFRPIVVESANFGRICLEDISVNGLEIRDCIINEIVLGPDGIEGGIKFTNCEIAKVSGAASAKGLPENMFGGGCVIDKYDNMGTNNAILQLDIPPQIKALVTILRKLYKQPGAGRKISALTRGITQKEVAKHVNGVTETLEKAGFVTIFNKIIHPVRKQTSRVENILYAPALSKDPVVAEVRAL